MGIKTECNCKDTIYRRLLLHISRGSDRNWKVFGVNVERLCHRCNKKSDPPCIRACAETQHRWDLEEFAHCLKTRSCFLFCFKRCEPANLKSGISTSCGEDKYIAFDKFPGYLQ